jgi:hypothetical protein
VREGKTVFQFDRRFVRHWSERYVAEEMGDGVERRLLRVVGPTAAVSGYLTSTDLQEIGRWKAVRATGYLARNKAQDIEDVTALALDPHTPERMRHWVLRYLQGIGNPVASAILTVWQPKRHTILDYRALEALQELQRLQVLGSAAPEGSQGSLPGYWTYLGLYRPVANRLGVSYRNLDRALWKWHKSAMPTR